MLTPLLQAAGRSPRARRFVTTSRATRPVVDRFVAGDDLGDALAAVHRLRGQGLLVTLDHLGEHTATVAQAEAVCAAYVRLLDALGGRAAGGAVEVSVKLSALGQALPGDVELSLAREICAAAARAATTVTVDMEEAATVDATLSTVRALRADFPWVGAVLQSALHRTEGDCRTLAHDGSRVRLVKGAYAEPAAVAHQRRADVDASYRRCLRVLMDGDGYPMVGTHDPALIALAEQLGADRAADSWELQMLYGIRVAEQRRLADAGHRMRVYVPYGTDWYGYFVRRLAERPANVVFFLRSFVQR